MALSSGKQAKATIMRSEDGTQSVKLQLGSDPASSGSNGGSSAKSGKSSSGKGDESSIASSAEDFRRAVRGLQGSEAAVAEMVDAAIAGIEVADENAEDPQTVEPPAATATV